MIKEKKEQILCCDMCEKELKEPIYTNDGIDRSEYFHDKEVILCYKCSSKILKKIGLAKEKYQELIKEEKKEIFNDEQLDKAIEDFQFVIKKIHKKYDI